MWLDYMNISAYNCCQTTPFLPLQVVVSLTAFPQGRFFSPEVSLHLILWIETKFLCEKQGFDGILIGNNTGFVVQQRILQRQ